MSKTGATGTGITRPLDTEWIYIDHKWLKDIQDDSSYYGQRVRVLEQALSNALTDLAWAKQLLDEKYGSVSSLVDRHADAYRKVLDGKP